MGRRGKTQPSCLHFLSRLKGQVKSLARILCLFYERPPLLLLLVFGSCPWRWRWWRGGTYRRVFQFSVTVFLDSGLRFLLYYPPSCTVRVIVKWQPCDNQTPLKTFLKLKKRTYRCLLFIILLQPHSVKLHSQNWQPNHQSKCCAYVSKCYCCLQIEFFPQLATTDTTGQKRKFSHSSSLK